MEPAKLYERKYHQGTNWFPGQLTHLVFELFQQLHDLKMSTDEPEIAQKSQELLDLLFDKYPNLVPTPSSKEK